MSFITPDATYDINEYQNDAQAFLKYIQSAEFEIQAKQSMQNTAVQLAQYDQQANAQLGQAAFMLARSGNLTQQKAARLYNMDELGLNTGALQLADPMKSFEQTLVDLTRDVHVIRANIGWEYDSTVFDPYYEDPASKTIYDFDAWDEYDIDVSGKVDATGEIYDLSADTYTGTLYKQMQDALSDAKTYYDLGQGIKAVADPGAKPDLEDFDKFDSEEYQAALDSHSADMDKYEKDYARYKDDLSNWELKMGSYKINYRNWQDSKPDADKICSGDGKDDGKGDGGDDSPYDPDKVDMYDPTTGDYVDKNDGYDKNRDIPAEEE